MAKTSAQILANHQEHADRSSRGLAAAHAADNAQLAALNIQMGFKSCLMQGLIAWRTELVSPIAPLKEAVARIEDGLVILRAIHGGSMAERLPLEKSAIITFLLEAPDSPILPLPETPERRLDYALATALRGNWDDTLWLDCLAAMRKTKRQALTAETYATYREILRSGPSEISRLVNDADTLFRRRAKDRFISGGDQTEGGGADNEITVDYRLGAVLKKVQYHGDSMHRWKWGSSA